MNACVAHVFLKDEGTKQNEKNMKCQLLYAIINHMPCWCLVVPITLCHTTRALKTKTFSPITVHCSQCILFSIKNSLVHKFNQTIPNTDQLKCVIRCIWLVENWKHTMNGARVNVRVTILPCCHQDYRNESHSCIVSHATATNRK